MPSVVLLCILAFLSLLTGCTTSGLQGAGNTSQAVKATATLPAPDSSVGRLDPNQSDYRVAPLDVVEIAVFQVPDLTRTVQVDAKGQVSLPLIGTVAAGGKTARELEVEIATKLGATYLQSPQVSVFIKESTGQRVTVEGAVNDPGVYPVAGQISLLQAVAMANGLDRVANPKNVIVFRVANQQRTAARFDITAIRSGKASDPVVYGGDTIVVDESGGRALLRSVTEALPVAGLFMPLL